MKLIHTIASYTGTSRKNIEHILNDEVKDIIIRVLESPQYAKQVDNMLLSELVEMDVFYLSDGIYKSNTAIFLEKDIEYLTDIVFLLSEGLSNILQKTVKDFTITSPNIRNFIYAIIAMGQGLHSSLINLGAASEWQTKTGKYEKSRVDFNEDCTAYHSFGNDLQNKNIIKGNKYTSVTIGYEMNDFSSYLRNNQNSDKIKDYNSHLSMGLIDLFPLLILGELDNPRLKQAAQAANINVDDKFSVITLSQSREYQPYIDEISAICSRYYCEKLKYIENALLTTTSGKSGTPVKNMMMNFWRYMRKAVAIKLYDSGFLTDKIPQNGSFTIFYENSIGYFNL